MSDQQPPTDNININVNVDLVTGDSGRENQTLRFLQPNPIPGTGSISINSPSSFTLLTTPSSASTLAIQNSRSLNVNNFPIGESPTSYNGLNDTGNVRSTIRTETVDVDPDVSATEILNSLYPYEYEGYYPAMLFMNNGTNSGTIVLPDQSTVPLKIDDDQLLFDNDSDIDEYAEIMSWATTPPSAYLSNEERATEVEVQTQYDPTVAYAAPPPPSQSTPGPSVTHENDLWICKGTYEAERQRDIDLWLLTLFPPNPTTACSGDQLALEQQKLSVMKKLVLLLAMGKLYLVKKRESIMDTMEDLHGVNISIASLLNHGKRIVVQFDGRYEAFAKLHSFLFPDKLFYKRESTHHIKFCSVQHHLQEVDLGKWASQSCSGMDFAYGGLGNFHRTDACTNNIKSSGGIGELLQIVAGGERKCVKSDRIVAQMQHGHLIVKVADKNPQGRFHGFLFGVENSRPLPTYLDGFKYKVGMKKKYMGMFDNGHGTEAEVGEVSVSGGLKRDRFLNLIERQPDNIGGIRLHLDTHHVESFYRAYRTMEHQHDQYEALFGSRIGGFTAPV